jgi:GNAT superfamily N-acetyltransferase
MERIEVRPVRTARERRTFLTFPWRIYRDDPLWVPPLLPERAKTIDPRIGTFFKRGGQAEFYIAWKNGEPVGTICAAEDRITNQQRNLRDCMFGFFECVDDEAVAKALFREASRWAMDHDLETLYGPFNLDYEDGYGVLIEGRERPPTILCGHTPSYYQDFVENYGFHPARGDNIAYEIDVDHDLPAIQRLSHLAERVRRRTDFSVRSADLIHWREEIERIYALINRSLAHLPDFIPWQREALFASLEPFRQIVDPDLVLFAESDGEVVGWFPGIPNLNEILIHVNGLRYPWDYLRLLRHQGDKPKCLAIKSVLVLPDYWDTGVSVLLFDEMAKRVLGKGYQWVDFSLTSDDNPNTPILATHAGARLYKRYRVYRLELVLNGIISGAKQ